MKVYELFTISELDGMQLIAGESGKDREVQSVNMMDAPDIIPFLKENEFLVTTAYHLKDHPHTLMDLVQSMSKQGCAALGIKTKRFLNEIPKDVIVLADELSFPIIELPLKFSLGQIVQQTFQTILNKRAAELTFALETHKQFTKIIMQGKGIQLLLHDLSRMINRPILLINQYFKPIYQSDPNFNLPSGLNGGTIPEVKTGPATFSFLDSRQTCTLFPVHISEKKVGFLMISGEIEKTDQLLLLTIEQAVNVISFALLKENALKQHDLRIRNEFFLHFLDGTFSSQEEIIGRAAEFSLQNNRKYICAAGKMDDDRDHPTYAEHHEKTEEIYEFIEDEVSNTSPKVHFFKKRDSCIFLFELKDSHTNPFNDVKSVLKKLQSRVSNLFTNTISFGVSNLCHYFSHVNDAYKEADDALTQGHLSRKKAFIKTYHTKDLIELMRQIPLDDLKNYYSHALSGFSELKTDEQDSLLETLSVYLETHCQISETAKRLFVHRNTVVYRIEKCEEILGKSLRDSETTMQLRLALRVKSLLED